MKKPILITILVLVVGLGAVYGVNYLNTPPEADIPPVADDTEPEPLETADTAIVESGSMTEDEFNRLFDDIFKENKFNQLFNSLGGMIAEDPSKFPLEDIEKVEKSELNYITDWSDPEDTAEKLVKLYHDWIAENHPDDDYHALLLTEAELAAMEEEPVAPAPVAVADSAPPASTETTYTEAPVAPTDTVVNEPYDPYAPNYPKITITLPDGSTGYVPERPGEAEAREIARQKYTYPEGTFLEGISVWNVERGAYAKAVQRPDGRWIGRIYYQDGTVAGNLGVIDGGPRGIEPYIPQPGEVDNTKPLIPGESMLDTEGWN